VGLNSEGRALFDLMAGESADVIVLGGDTT
jgi:hypothetical protein